jgi:hypothetical protein
MKYDKRDYIKYGAVDFVSSNIVVSRKSNNIGFLGDSVREKKESYVIITRKKNIFTRLKIFQTNRATCKTCIYTFNMDFCLSLSSFLPPEVLYCLSPKAYNSNAQ